MPAYYFTITCTECSGSGYVADPDPFAPIQRCENCDNGLIEIEDFYDCEADLKQDYPDARIIITENK